MYTSNKCNKMNSLDLLEVFTHLVNIIRNLDVKIMIQYVASIEVESIREVLYLNDGNIISPPYYTFNDTRSGEFENLIPSVDSYDFLEINSFGKYDDANESSINICHPKPLVTLQVYLEETVNFYKIRTIMESYLFQNNLKRNLEVMISPIFIKFKKYSEENLKYLLENVKNRMKNSWLKTKKNTNHLY